MIRLQRDGSIEALSPNGPIVFTTWKLESSFLEVFAAFELPEEDLRKVYLDFARQRPSRARVTRQT